MNNIQLNIVANAQFQQVYAEVAKLKSALTTLQQTSVGGPFTSGVQSDIKAAQSQFDSAVLSTRAFTIQQVAMTDSVAKFGQQLSRGQLSLQNYYKIWRDSAKGTSAEIDALATSQARLNRSMAVADPLKPGYAKLVTDINGVVTAEEKLVFQQQALNTALQQGAMKLVDFGKNTQWMGRQLTVGLTMPLAMFGAAASQAYLSFDKQMTQMLQVYGAHATVQSQATLDLIQKQVTSLADKLARTLGVAMTDTVTVAQTFSSIGLEGQNLIAATEATVRLQRLGNLSAQQASTSMVALQNVFKLQANQIGDAVNFLNAAKHSTSTTMQDIVDALPRVGPIIQQLGGSYKDFTTFLVALKESGVPAAQGANAIKSMLASIINPTTAAQKALSALHINIKQIVADNQGNPMGMVTGLQASLSQLPSEQRLKAIEQVFGKFQFARVTALIDNLGKSGSQSAKVLELYNQSNAQLASVANQELKVSSSGTPAAQFQKMKATLQADLLPLGRSFLQAFTQIGNAVDHIYNAIKGIANMMGPVAGILGKVFGTGFAGLIIIGPVIMLVGLFANLIGNILRGANSIRMFRQGMQEALPSQNAFMAGIKGMRNFYQELDAAEIAARNQMELMPEAITTNAKAFEILRTEIVKLTEQFVLLAKAQTSAMGGSLTSSLFSEIGTVLPKTGTAFLKIVPKKNQGGMLPGFNSGGSIYDPSRHGSVVPGPSNVNYDSVLASVPVGGFVLNKAASKKNPGLATLPKFASGGRMLAMLTPGETVFDPKTTAANYNLLSSANSGMNIAGGISEGQFNYGIWPAVLEENLVFKKMFGHIADPKLKADAAESFALKHYGFDPTRRKPGLWSLLDRKPYVDPKTGYIRGSARAMDELTGKTLKPGERYDMFGSKITAEGKTILGYSQKPSVGVFGKSDTYGELIGFNNAKASATGITDIKGFLRTLVKYSKEEYGTPYIYGSTNHFLRGLEREGIVKTADREAFDEAFHNAYIGAVESRSVLRDSDDPYHITSLKILKERFGKSNPQVLDLYNQWLSKESAYNPQYLSGLIPSATGHTSGASGAKGLELDLPNGKKIKYDPMKGASAGGTNSTELPGSFFFHGSQDNIPHLAKGGSIGAHHRKSPVYSYTGSDVYRGQTRRMKASLGVHYNSYKAPHTRGLKGWNSGGVLGGLIHPSKPNYGVASTAVDILRNAGNLWRYGKMAAPAVESSAGAVVGAGETIAKDVGFMSKFSGMFKLGFLARIGPLLKFSLYSFLPQILGAIIPNKIGGLDLTGVKKIGLGGLGAGLTAAAFSASAPVAVGIGIAVAAFKGVSWYFAQNKKALLEHQALVQKVYTGNAQTVALFNNEAKKTPQALAESIKSLNNNNSTKQVANYIGTLKPTQAIQTLDSYVASQVLSGLDSSKIDGMVKSILIYNKQTQLLDPALKTISNDNKNLAETTKTYLDDLKLNITYNDHFSTSYKTLSSDGKNYANALYNIYSSMDKNVISGTKLDEVIQGLSLHAQDAATQMRLLAEAAAKAGDTKMTGLIDDLNKLLGNAAAVKGALAALDKAQQLTGISSQQILNENKDLFKTADDFKNPKIWNQALLNSQRLEQSRYDAAKKVAGIADSTNNLLNKQLTSLKDQKKVADALLASEKQKANVLNQQNDYLNKQTDLTNQIKQAEISGNYIQAAQLKQQQDQNTAKYKEQSTIDTQQAFVDSLQTSIADLEQKISDAAAAASKQAAAAQIMASFAKIISDNSAQIAAFAAIIAKDYGSGSSGGGGAITPSESGIIDSNAKKLPIGSVRPNGTTVRSGDSDAQDPTIPLPTTINGKKAQSFHNPFGFPPYNSRNAWTASDPLSAATDTQAAQVRQHLTEPTKGADGNWYSYNGFVYSDFLKTKVLGTWLSITGSGQIRAFSEGSIGGVKGPGTSTSDSIPAWLSNGEYVVKADSVSKYGTPFFDALNAGHFAKGSIGGVGPSSKSNLSNITDALRQMFTYKYSDNTESVDKLSGTRKYVHAALMDVLRLSPNSFQLSSMLMPIIGKKKVDQLFNYMYQSGARPIEEVLAGSGTKGDWFNTLTMFSGSASSGSGIKNVPKLFKSLKGIKSLFAGIKDVENVSKDTSLLNLSNSEYNKLIKSIYKRKEVEVGNFKLPTYKLNGSDATYAFRGKGEDLSALKGVKVVPTAPIPILQEILRLNPKNKEVLSLLKNFQKNNMTDKENKFLTEMMAAVSMTKKGKAMGIQSTDGFAMLMSSFGKGKEAKTARSIIDLKTSKYLNALKDENILKTNKLSDKYKEVSDNFMADYGEEADISSVPVIHSTKYPVVRNPDGSISLQTAAQHRILGKSPYPRPSIHFTLEAPVQSHVYGSWADANNKIVTNLSSMIDNNGLPYNLNPTDTWWMKKPGELLKISNASVIRPFDNMKKYAEELIKRNLLKPGEKPPVMAVDPISKDILHMSKTKYSLDDIKQISELANEHNLQVSNSWRTLNENQILEKIATKLAKEQIGINTGLPPDMGAHNLESPYMVAKIKSIMMKLNLGADVHAHSSAGVWEQFYSNIKKVKLNGKFPRIPRRPETDFDSDIATLLENARHGNFNTNILMSKKYWADTRETLAKGGLVGLPSYKVGTPYVPNNQLALLHKGEAVIPANQNTGAYGGTVNVYVNATGVTDPKQITQMAQDGVMKALNIKDAKINKTNMAVRV